MASDSVFVTLGMFIIDQFEFLDEEGNPTERPSKNEIGGGGTYAVVGARAWLDSPCSFGLRLPPDKLGMIVDRGPDFPPSMQKTLEAYGNMWLFRDRADTGTTKALNSYRGEHRSFKYLTPRLRITPQDLRQTKLDRPKILHFICSPSRAGVIMTEAREIQDWEPIAIYEPIPDRCIPEELPALISILPEISILSPNAEEALSLLSISLPPTPSSIEKAAHIFLGLGVKDAVVIRSGGLGAYVLTEKRGGKWIPAFWSDEDTKEVVDVTGAGNSFLGGLAAGLHIADGDVYEASLYGAVSASFAIQQGGLPTFSGTDGSWNQDFPARRLKVLRKRCN
ncbi:Ribokinase-like protein [Marasmius fiardii PR-910]|nr:Ribokinase-like protein [Marasmius fiardii PR-910]